MKVQYDPSADAMYIRLAEGTVADSDEVRDGVVLDYDARGKVLGIEVLKLSQRADKPHEMAFELMPSAPSSRPALSAGALKRRPARQR